MMKLVVVLSFCAFFYVHCSPIRKRTFQEAEYDIVLKKNPGEKSYFIKQDELPIYQQQFAKIKELGEEINCKITGNCQTKKRGMITKKSMFDSMMPENNEAAFGDQMNGDSMGGAMGGAMGGGEDVSAATKPKMNSFMGSQKGAAAFGQQPQMDIKMSEREMAAMQGGMGGDSMPGAGGPPAGGPGGPMAGLNGPPPSVDGNDALMRLRDQQNNKAIEDSIQDKVSFMDKANGIRAGSMGGGPMGMPGMPGVSDPLSQFPHAEGKDETPSSGPGGVSENDLLKAEDIQPNEMKGIDSFLKDSNHVDKEPGESSINDGPNDDEGSLGKTNVDFGGSQASIDNNEANSQSENSAMSGGPMGSPSGGAPVSPGGPEVPTLNNVGLGMSPGEFGPPNAAPNIKFVQDNTRQMIQQNSDYKVPQPALSSLWNSYMASTQSVLGEKDPSANSRQSISRPAKLHRRSNKKSTRSQ